MERGVFGGHAIEEGAVFHFDVGVEIHLTGEVEADAVQAAGGFVAEAGDAIVDDVGCFVGADQGVFLALQVAVRDAGRVHGLDRLEQPGEEAVAILEPGRQAFQRRAGNVLEDEVLGYGEAEAARDAAYPLQAVVDARFTTNGAAPEPGEQRIRMRALDDELAGPAFELAYDCLIAMPDDAALEFEIAK